MSDRGEDIGYHTVQGESQAIHIAVVGCTHGEVDAVYASIKRTALRSGRREPDLVIMCGDFQACRNEADLRVTAMPEKYRQMGEFHRYYSGERLAPYLTVIIGGNHEASNYFYELYYGGWIAPNMYYLGAANIIKFGPLRIAAMSGIWKSYDYGKNHFERLPYNESELTSIYHQRELDVRKLLSYTNQVDICLSHDWPQRAVEYGDYNLLLKYKGHFRDDIQKRQLGSPAAQRVMDFLRPAYWFSAHLHAHYPAMIRHGDYNQGKLVGERGRHIPPAKRESAFQHLTTLSIINEGANAAADQSHDRMTTMELDSDILQSDVIKSGVLEPNLPGSDRPKRVESSDTYQDRTPVAAFKPDTSQATRSSGTSQRRGRDVTAALAAWSNFGQVAMRDEADQNRKAQEEQANRRAGLKNGTIKLPEYNFVQKHKQVDVTEDGQDRKVKSMKNGGENSDEMKITASPGDDAIPSMAEAFQNTTNAVHNPDMIDLESNASDEENTVKAIVQMNGPADVTLMGLEGCVESSNGSWVPHSRQAQDSVNRWSDTLSASSPPPASPSHAPTDDSEILPIQASQSNNDGQTSEGTAYLARDYHHNKSAQFDPEQTAKTPSKVTTDGQAMLDPGAVSWTPSISLRADAPSFTPVPSTPLSITSGVQSTDSQSDGAQPMHSAKDDEGVSAWLRAQLGPAFAPQSPLQLNQGEETNPRLPKAVTNQVTKFLGLSKPGPGREFLQFLDVEPLSKRTAPQHTALKLEYDPEWLAITRAYRGDLKLGGNPDERVHQGVFQPSRVADAQNWIREHVQDFIVPQNFEKTAPTYTERAKKSEYTWRDQPKELPNPQTEAFCNLIGIENIFRISEQEIQARWDVGPRQDRNSRVRRDGRGGERGRGRGRGGRTGQGGRGGRGGRGGFGRGAYH